nr:MAG TPA: hypothetical protein [Caudoviricetes sp.]
MSLKSWRGEPTRMLLKYNQKLQSRYRQVGS